MTAPSHLGLTGPVSLGIAATIAFSGAGSAWVAIDGGPMPSRHVAGAHVALIQIGVRDGPTQPGGIADDSVPHYFAAWGDQERYVELDLGRATPGTHRYAVYLSGDSYALAIDGHIKMRSPIPPWAPVKVVVAAESHAATMPHVSVWSVKTGGAGAWRVARLTEFGAGDAAMTASHPHGRDWLSVS